MKFIGLSIALICASTMGQAREFPSDSVYRLDVPLTSQDQLNLRLPSYAGHVRIMTMFYASCSYVCPMTIQYLKDLESELSDIERARMRISLITIDPDRDTMQALSSLAAKHKLDTRRWSLSRAKSEDVRKIAGILGVQYRQLANKEFNHSTVLVLISPDGKIIGRADTSNGIDSSFTAELRKQLATQ